MRLTRTVLEYCSKGPVMKLEEGKTSEPIDPRYAWVFFRDIIQGLDYCTSVYIMILTICSALSEDHTP